MYKVERLLSKPIILEQARPLNVLLSSSPSAYCFRSYPPPINFNISVELPFAVVERYISIVLRLRDSHSFALCSLLYQRTVWIVPTPLSVSFIKQCYSIVIIDMLDKNNQIKTFFLTDLANGDV